jgi:hypothetical protein
MTKQERMKERIVQHGLLLQRYYGNSTQGPVSLCKALRRIETRIGRLCESLCNDADFDQTILDRAEKSATKKVKELLPNLDMKHFFINQDPRGYALKIKSEHRPDDLHSDWGGYGILAPDFTND